MGSGLYLQLGDTIWILMQSLLKLFLVWCKLHPVLLGSNQESEVMWELFFISSTIVLLWPYQMTSNSKSYETLREKRSLHAAESNFGLDPETGSIHWQKSLIKNLQAETGYSISELNTVSWFTRMWFLKIFTAQNKKSWLAFLPSSFFKQELTLGQNKIFTENKNFEERNFEWDASQTYMNRWGNRDKEGE